MTNKMAAVWARVSTEPQQSLDSQVARAKAELEKQGYIIPEERILKVDWTSLDLFSCPEFKQLMSWIQRREIGALGILDRDRLNAIGLQRLTFLSECRENDVNLVICQGPPLLAEPEGQLVELALAIGKERQVLRAQQGARDALRERATVRGLPVTCQSPYGYIWDKSRTRLIATDKWSIREKIIRLFLQGATLKGIVKELQRAAILSPKGRDYWPEPTISLILKDTINYGEYRALRREAVQPKTRRGNTYGKSSSTTSEGILLSNITVEKNIISKVEHDFILQRLERNRINAKRNSKRHYLLSGMIHFEGDNLRYHARDIRHKSWAYQYSARGKRMDNPRRYLPGPKTERVVEEKARALLTSPEVIEVELGLRDSAIKESIARLENEQKRLEQELAQGINSCKKPRTLTP